VDTKLKGDIAEQAAILHALKQGWGVLKLVGDRRPYDLVFDVSGTLVKIQVKSAWLDTPSSEIHLVEAEKRQRKPRSIKYREAWQLILQYAAVPQVPLSTDLEIEPSSVTYPPS
jgi:hypothetical protein